MKISQIIKKNLLVENKFIILLYHGVEDTKTYGIQNYNNKHISTEEFDHQINFLSKHCNVISLKKLISYFSQKKNFPKNTVVITFDDGFENNYTKAIPILKKYSLPATFYISIGNIINNEMFWVDKIEDCINYTLKRNLRLKLDHEINFKLESNSQKIVAVNNIKTWCKSIVNYKKDLIIDEIINKLEVIPKISSWSGYKLLKLSQINEIDKSELFEIGGHSYKHKILSMLSNDELKIEINDSIFNLQKILNRKIDFYAYPEGQEHHFDKRVIKLLKDKNIACCPTAIPGVNSLGDDLFNLKRYMVGMNGINFE